MFKHKYKHHHFARSHYDCMMNLFYFQLKSKSLTHLDRIQPQINISSNDIHEKVSIVNLYKNLQSFI